MNHKRKHLLMLAVLIFASLNLSTCTARREEPVEIVEALDSTVNLDDIKQTPEYLEQERPVTLNMIWMSDPPTIDPAFTTDSLSFDVTHNLFVSVTNYDPVTSEVIPHLATDWWSDYDKEGNPIWTFTLRDDIPWVQYDNKTGEVIHVVDDEGRKRYVNAYDVEYGVKRTIDPTVASDYAYVLYVIKNAYPINSGEEGYNVDMLGIEALDERTIQYTLEYDAAYFPAIAGLWVGNPVPRWAIDEWGDKWTEAGMINTSGPYTLESWHHGLEISLIKNPLWPKTEEVQIERVKGAIVPEEATALAMYENNEVDTVTVAPREIDRIRADSVLGIELYNAPESCTAYLGFTNNKAPLNDVRVRRALVQAIDRQSLIDNVLKGGEILATSFAPPGIFGAPPPGEVGLHYDPEAARASLQEYLDEVDMTIEDFNALRIYIMTIDHESNIDLMSAIQQMWQETLGIKTRLDVQEYKVYLDTISVETPLVEMPHIWWTGWCADYADENNWVHDVFNVRASFNDLRRNCLNPNCEEVYPTEFDELTAIAALEPDPAKRIELYAEAERILAEDEVAYAPLYYATSLILTKPWLQRNFPLLSGIDIYNWELDMEEKLESQR